MNNKIFSFYVVLFSFVSAISVRFSYGQSVTPATPDLIVGNCNKIEEFRGTNPNRPTICDYYPTVRFDLGDYVTEITRYYLRRGIDSYDHFDNILDPIDGKRLRIQHRFEEVVRTIEFIKKMVDIVDNLPERRTFLMTLDLFATTTEVASDINLKLNSLNFGKKTDEDPNGGTVGDELSLNLAKQAFSATFNVGASRNRIVSHNRYQWRVQEQTVTSLKTEEPFWFDPSNNITAAKETQIGFDGNALFTPSTDRTKVNIQNANLRIVNESTRDSDRINFTFKRHNFRLSGELVKLGVPIKYFEEQVRIDKKGQNIGVVKGGRNKSYYLEHRFGIITITDPLLEAEKQVKKVSEVFNCSSLNAGERGRNLDDKEIQEKARDFLGGLSVSSFELPFTNPILFIALDKNKIYPQFCDSDIDVRIKFPSTLPVVDYRDSGGSSEPLNQSEKHVWPSKYLVSPKKVISFVPRLATKEVVDFKIHLKMRLPSGKKVSRKFLTRYNAALFGQDAFKVVRTLR